MSRRVTVAVAVTGGDGGGRNLRQGPGPQMQVSWG